MSDYDRCGTCGEYDFTKRHKCDPCWLVLNADEPDEWTTIYARDAQHAGEKWADREDCDSAEYSIVAGTPATVFVKPEIGTDDPVLFVVRGEAVPVYTGEAARSIRCDWHQCSQHRQRSSIGAHNIGTICPDCGRGRWEATTMLPVDPEVNEVERAAEGLSL